MIYDLHTYVSLRIACSVVKAHSTHAVGPASIPGAVRKKVVGPYYQIGWTFKWIYKPRFLVPLHLTGK